MRRMDPENPVVKLCGQGIQAELARRDDEARDCFQRAWDVASDDYEACIAAHYLARHQPTPEDTRHWNQVSLDRALAVDDARVRPFFASLHLNLGRCAEDQGDLPLARAHYQQALDALPQVSEGPYRSVVEHGIGAALARVAR
ncbi:MULTISPECIES: tetratricopeptide repeat protein [Corallococcus]|uniref:tetratricopeptide repeat protein n=1 Tax=Corallococcus TaxID=83461 RepID=UPI00117EDE78|nr:MULTISPECIES: tetratricopeptide repeat protein [Corallococcus]NBD08702.1 tetratricopeptide repeat protein [Corallococcus silvisoli]TSC32666.1 tetratricopeptide repeat protein [Corallococcus sp. Z5C101001]